MIEAENKEENKQKQFLFTIATSYKTLLDQIKPIEKDKKVMREEILVIMRNLGLKKADDGKIFVNVGYRDKFDAERFLHEHPEHESLVKKVIKTEYLIEKKDLGKLEKTNPALFQEYNKRSEALTVK